MSHISLRCRMPIRRLFLIAVLTFLLPEPAAAAAPGMVEIESHGRTYQGKLEVKASNACWLLGRDGRMRLFKTSEIESIRTLSTRFREFSAAELRDQLRRELPKEFRIDGTDHFLICSERGGHRIGEICEDTFRTFHHYFAVRGFHISEPRFPMVAIVFPDRAGFVDYCRKDGITPLNGMLGYYMRLTNRTALFDLPDRGSTAELKLETSPLSFADVFSRGEEHVTLDLVARFDATVEADLHSTIVHETTHQVAFNTGLHSRIGQSPKWVIEGLATMFEAPGIRDSKAGAAARTRINRGRYIWFMNYLKSRRQPHSLSDFVSTDDLYDTAILDAYSEGWALTFFLAETRHGSYVRYLKSVAQRNPLRAYTASERRVDFRKAFGDLRSVESEYLRFYDNLATAGIKGSGSTAHAAVR